LFEEAPEDRGAHLPADPVVDRVADDGRDRDEPEQASAEKPGLMAPSRENDPLAAKAPVAKSTNRPAGTG
jgi:hypothetical protein